MSEENKLTISGNLSRIKEAKQAIKKAIVKKGGTVEENWTIDRYAAAIDAIQVGSNVDFAGVTVTADKLLKDIIAIDVDGNKVTGTIETVEASLTDNVVTVPAGYIATEQIVTVGVATDVESIIPGIADQTIAAGTYLSKVLTIEGDTNLIAENIKEGISIFGITGTYEGGSSVDLSFITATASDILAGKIGADVDGNQVIGTIETVSAEISGNVVTIPAGYNATAQTVTVGTAKAAQTYTPSTADQTIPADTYLSGIQTIKGDVNLVAENIKEGISIFSITGTYSGGSSMDFYKCAAVHSPSTVTRITVANAGTTAVNGDYEKTDLTTESGGEVWKHTSAEYYMYPDSYGIWAIHSDYPPTADGALYYCYDGVAGVWADGSGSLPAPTVTKGEVTTGSGTWDGYKAVLTDGVYSFEETITSGLTYSSVTPEVDKIYTNGALVEIKSLYGISGDVPNDVTITVSSETYNVEWEQYSTISNIQLSATVSDNGIPLFVASNLPSGISVSSNGRISGTPSEVTEGSFKVYVAYPGAVGKEITINYNVLLQRGYIELSIDNLVFEVGKEFSHQYQPYTTNGGNITGYTATGLPDGITLSESGLLSGIPTTETSSASFTLNITAYRCDDFSRSITYVVLAANDNSFETPYNWEDIASGTAVTDFDKTELKANKQKVYIKVPLTAGVEYTFWCISDNAGNFDEYLWLYDMNNTELASNDDTDGGSKITYTPSTTGDYMLVLGSYNNAGVGKFNEITVTPAPSAEEVIINVTTPVTLTGTQNSAITDLQLTATVSDGGQATFTSSNLPEGLTLSESGLISGTPVTSGEGSSIITVSYTGAESKTITLNWSIEAAGDKTYVYTVSGAGDSDANGDYWATGETVKIKTTFIDSNDESNIIQKDTEYPIYTNGTYYIVPNEGIGQYIIDDAVTPNGPPNYKGPSVNTGTLSEGVYIAHTPADGSWEVLGGTSPAPTVTAYANPDTPTDKTYVYTVTAPSQYADAAGDYWEVSGEELDELYPQNHGASTGTYYINGKGWRLSQSDLGFCRIEQYLSSPEYTGWDTEVSDTEDSSNPSAGFPSTGLWSNDFDVVAYSAPSGGDETYVYTVSGAGLDEANGNYSDNGDGTFSNANGCKIYYDSDVFNMWLLSVPSFGAAYTDKGQNGDSSPYLGAWDCYAESASPAPTVTAYTSSTKQLSQYQYLKVAGATTNTEFNDYFYKTSITSSTAQIVWVGKSGVTSDGRYICMTDENNWYIAYTYNRESTLPEYFSEDGGKTWINTSGTIESGMTLTGVDSELACLISSTSKPEINGTYTSVKYTSGQVHSAYSTGLDAWTNGSYSIIYCPDYWQGWTLVSNDKLTEDPSSAYIGFIMASDWTDEKPMWSCPDSSWDINITITPTEI